MAPDLEGNDEPGAAIDEPAEATNDQENAGQENAEQHGADQDHADQDHADQDHADQDHADGEHAEPRHDVEPEPAPVAEPVPVAIVPVEDEPAFVPAFTRFRVLTFLAIGPLITGYVAVAALLALVTSIAGNAHFTTPGVLLAALPGWLAAHQVPLEIGGLELGILPLLPTIGVAALTARAAAGAAVRLDLRRPRQAGVVVGVVAVAHAVTGLVLAALLVDAEVTVDVLAALYYPALVSALAAGVGVVRRCGVLAAVVRRADAVAVAGLRTGALAVVLLLVAGGALLTFGLAMSVPAARELFPKGTGDAVGMLLLSIGYVPNAIVAATAFLAGPGFSLGTIAVAPLEFHGGQLPGVPLLAALPEHQAAWWPALCVLPLLVGVVVGRRLSHADENPVTRLRGVAVATGVVAMCFVVLAGTAGGRLGGGLFDPVSMRAVALSIALVLWIAIPGAITAWFGGPRAPMEPLPGLIDEDLDQPDDETPREEPEEQEAEVPGPREAVEESGETVRD